MEIFLLGIATYLMDFEEIANPIFVHFLKDKLIQMENNSYYFFPVLPVTDEMLDYAATRIEEVKVDRTIASKIDTLTGILGELIFAEYFYGDWEKNNIGSNKGKNDFPEIEIKTSAFPFSANLNLLVREDYAAKRKPKAYVQIVVDVDSSVADEIKEGTTVYICGWATAEEIDNAPIKDAGSKLSKYGGYKCRYISIKKLHPMNKLKDYLFNNSSNQF